MLYFTKKGEYVKEIKIAGPGGRLVEPWGDQFVGRTFMKENGKLYHGILYRLYKVLFDKNMILLRSNKTLLDKNM